MSLMLHLELGTKLVPTLFLLFIILWVDREPLRLLPSIGVPISSPST